MQCTSTAVSVTGDPGATASVEYKRAAGLADVRLRNVRAGRTHFQRATAPVYRAADPPRRVALAAWDSTLPVCLYFGISE